MSRTPRKRVLSTVKIQGVDVSITLEWANKKKWDANKGSRGAARIVNDLLSILHGEVAHRVIEEQRSADRGPFGPYSKRFSKKGFQTVIPPTHPQPKPYAFIDEQGNAYYRDRWHYERAAGRDPRKRRGVLSGRMWASWVKAINSPVKGKVRFKGSSPGASKETGEMTPKRRKFANRAKAKSFSIATGKDLIAISNKEYRLCLDYVDQYVSATHFQDAMSKRDAFKAKSKKRRAHSRWKRVLSQLRK